MGNLQSRSKNQACKCCRRDFISISEGGRQFTLYCSKCLSIEHQTEVIRQSIFNVEGCLSLSKSGNKNAGLGGE